MKDKLKLLLRWAIIFLFCFITIYLFVFVGCWKLFESGDPIFIEIGVAIILSFFVLLFIEMISILEKRVKALEDRIKELEKK
jgi:hypothetical protein